MGFLTDTAEQRKRQWHDPQEYEYQPGSQIISPNVAVPEGMVTGQPAVQPVAPAPAPQQLVQPAAQLPAATPGPVVTPMFAPTTSPAQYQNLKQNYERAGMQAPPPPQPTATPPAIPQSTGPTGYKQQLDLATAQRKQATNARYLAAGKKPPYPEAMPQAPVAPAPASIFGEPTGDPNLDNAYSSDSTLKRLKDEEDHDALRKEKRGDSPELQARAAKRATTAEIQRVSVRKTYQTEKKKKDDDEAAKSAKDAETTQRSIESHQWAQESHAAGEDARKTAAADKKRNQDMSKLLGAAQDAAKDGRFDDAEKAAEAGQKNANTPAEAAAFNAIRKEVQDGRTNKAAAAFMPQVTAAKAKFAQAETARTAELSRYTAFDKSFIAARTKYELYVATKSEDEAKEVEAAKRAMDAAWTKVKLSQAKIDTLTKARDDAQSQWNDLADQYAAIKSGQAPAQTQGGSAPATPMSAAAKPASQAEYDALPSGTKYVHRDGSTREKK